MNKSDTTTATSTPAEALKNSNPLSTHTRVLFDEIYRLQSELKATQLNLNIDFHFLCILAEELIAIKGADSVIALLLQQEYSRTEEGKRELIGFLEVMAFSYDFGDSYEHYEKLIQDNK